MYSTKAKRVEMRKRMNENNFLRKKQERRELYENKTGRERNALT